MPLYDYRCEHCGDFRDWRSMSQSSEPAPCPSCAAPAPRVLRAPSMNLMATGRRIAHERNEKSAHEPQVMTRRELDRVGTPLGHGHGYGHSHSHSGSGPSGSGHNHGHGHGHGGGGGTSGGAAEARVHRSNRPWMVGH